MAADTNTARGLAVAQDPILRFTLQYLAQHGFDLPTDGVAAREWCEKQAALGDADAQVASGEMRILGLYGEENSESAKLMVQQAADQGHPAALLMLANFLESGSAEERPDVNRALAMIEAAAQKGYPPALTQLGVVHLHGINVEPNPDLAMQYLRRGAELGDAHAQFMLGANLIKESIPSLVREGIGWIEKAATQGFAGAHRHLGYLYKEGGNGLPQDEEKSRRHFFTAAQIEENASAGI